MAHFQLPTHGGRTATGRVRLVRLFFGAVTVLGCSGKERPTEPPLEPAALTVVVTTTQLAPTRGDYRILIDGELGTSLRAQGTDSAQIRNLEPGLKEVSLDNLHPYCRARVAAKRLVTLHGGGTARLTWDVLCDPVLFERIVYVQRGYEGGGGTKAIHPDGSQPLHVADAWGDHPSVSPDGRLILFAIDRLYAAVPLAAPGSGVPLNGTLGHVAAAWSPDGRYIASWRVAEGRVSLIVMNSDGTGQRELISEPDSSWGVTLDAPSWSPDGMTLAVQTEATFDAPAIALVRVDGSGIDRFVIQSTSFGHRVVQPTISPDGRRIAFVGLVNLYVANLDGSGLEQLTATPETGEEFNLHPAWSPQGNELVFVRTEGPFETGTIWRIDVATKAQTQLTVRKAWVQHPVWVGTE